MLSMSETPARPPTPRPPRTDGLVEFPAFLELTAFSESTPLLLRSDGMKECPLCGESMRLSVREIRESIPGSGQASVRVTREWICPECDYFEEAETGEE